jgi:heptosyltransferase III
MRLLFLTATRLGDAILSTGVLAHWLRQAPDLEATVACGPVPAPLFSACPAVREVWEMRKQPRHGHWKALWKQASPIKWDAVIDLRGSAFAWTVRSRKRIVFRPRRQWEGLHKVAQFQALLGLPSPPSPHVWFQDAHAVEARTLIPGKLPALAMGPAANWRGKQWPAERFAETALQLTAPGGVLAGAPVAVLAAPNEQDQLKPLLARLPAERTHVLCGTSLPTLAAWLKGCALYIGNDSGLMHLAAAAGAPVLGLFGPSDERVYGPWGSMTGIVRTLQTLPELTCAPDYDHRTTGTLMNGLSVESVVKAAEALYQRL